MSLKEVVSLAQPPKTSMAGFPGMTDAHTFSLDWQVRYKRLMSHSEMTIFLLNLFCRAMCIAKLLLLLMGVKQPN